MSELQISRFLSLLFLSLSVDFVQGDVTKGSSSVDPVVATVDVSAARDLLISGYRYLDVRTEEEFKKGHPEGAVNVPYVFFTPQGREKNPEFLDKVSQILRKDDAIVVGCASGVRSLSAARDLLKAGYKNATNVGGGFLAWTEKGFEVTSFHVEL